MRWRDTNVFWFEMFRFGGMFMVSWYQLRRETDWKWSKNFQNFRAPISGFRVFHLHSRKWGLSLLSNFAEDPTNVIPFASHHLDVCSLEFHLCHIMEKVNVVVYIFWGLHSHAMFTKCEQTKTTSKLFAARD